jgi:hypothetical protein
VLSCTGVSHAHYKGFLDDRDHSYGSTSCFAGFSANFGPLTGLQLIITKIYLDIITGALLLETGHAQTATSDDDVVKDSVLLWYDKQY